MRYLACFLVCLLVTVPVSADVFRVCVRVTTEDPAGLPCDPGKHQMFVTDEGQWSCRCAPSVGDSGYEFYCEEVASGGGSGEYLVASGESYRYIDKDTSGICFDSTVPSDGTCDFLMVGNTLQQVAPSTDGTRGQQLPQNSTATAPTLGGMCLLGADDSLWLWKICEGESNAQPLVQGTDSDAFGPLLWGKDDGAANTHDTGDKICALNGYACVTTHQLDGTPQICTYDHTTAYFYAFCK